MKNFKVIEVSIPKLKNGYLTDYRTVRFDNKEDSWSVECFRGGHDISVNDKVEVSVRSMRDCNPMSLNKEGWNYYESYVCVSSNADIDDGILYEFHKEGDDSLNKPYSIIWGRSTEKFEVGDSYVFCYKKVE